MILQLEQVEHDPVEIDVSFGLPELRGETGEPLLTSELHLVALARRGDRGVVLEGRWSTAVQLPCSRCLELYPVELADAVYLVFEVGPEPIVAHEHAMDLEEANVFRLETPHADLRAVAAEQVLLALPLKPLCRADCAGLCATCGANRNRLECGCHPSGADPRLSPLQELRDRFRSRTKD